MNAALEDPAVWNDPQKAQELGKEKKRLDDVVLVLDDLARNLADNAELYEMSREEGDEAALQAIADDVQRLQGTVEQLEFRRMFNQPADPSNCLVSAP